MSTYLGGVLTGFRLKYVSTYLGGECLDRLQVEVCEYLRVLTGFRLKYVSTYLGGECLDRLQAEVCEYLPWW